MDNPEFMEAITVERFCETIRCIVTDDPRFRHLETAVVYTVLCARFLAEHGRVEDTQRLIPIAQSAISIMGGHTEQLWALLVGSCLHQPDPTPHSDLKSKI